MERPEAPRHRRPALDGFACRDGRESLVLGLRADGTIAHVSEVPSGLDCGCTCPGCGTRLVARKGHKQDHHFGHVGPDDGAPCATGPETALHRFAKEVLERRLELVLPRLELDDGRERWVGYEGGRYGFDAAVLEHRLGGIVPDVIARRGGRDLLVEFAVTHPCDEVKVARIAGMDVSAIEIDLSRLPRDVDRTGIEEAILAHAPRRWLHNPKLREGVAELGRMREAREQGLRQLYARACRQVASMRTVCLAYDRIEADGLAGAVGLDVPGIGCFTVPPRDWQSVTLAAAIDMAVSGGSRVISLPDALRRIKERRWLHRRFARLTDDEMEVIRADGTPFEPPTGALAAWAFALSREGILVPTVGGRWIIAHEVVEAAREARHRR
jgi:hypothetical protein